MKVSALRAVDRWLGVPACFLLTLHRRLFRRRAPAGPVRRILFVKLAEQGSTVLAVEAFERAVARVGRGNVFALVFRENRFILDALDVIPRENVVTLDAGTLAGTARSIFSVLRRLWKADVDAAVGLEFFARASAIFTYMSGATRRVGLHSYAGEGPWCGDLHTHRVVYSPYLHTSQLFAVMVDALDQPPGLFPAFPELPPDVKPAVPTYRPSPEDLATVRGLLGEVTGLADVPPVILLNANCSDMLPLRRWDRAGYVDLARRLLKARPELYVVLTGGPGEGPDAERLAAEVGSPRCVSLAGRTTLGQLLALYGMSEVLVTNDSGPAHFATLTPVDVVTLFGPETPALFAARTPRNHVLWAGLVCSPCVNAFNNRLSRCHENLCMKRITVDQVFEATMSAYLARQRETCGAVAASPIP